MAAARRGGRSKPQLPTCYYEGYLEKRSFKDKLARKLWTCLCGNSLFFFNNSKDNNYVEKLDLSEFVSLTDDPSLDRNLEAARLQLHLKNGSVHLTAPSLETRELWKGFIFSVVELSVPSSLHLLPGQIVMMKEVVEKEKERRKPIPASPPAAPTNGPTVPASAYPIYISPLADMPTCYHQVSRSEAEFLLERNADKGNMLLRPGQDGASFAVSTRQKIARPVFRHYRVTRRPEGGFAIAVENPIPQDTLHDVVNYFLERTDGVLKPLVLEQAYEKTIIFIQSNEENGENSERRASSSPVPPLPKIPPKPARIAVTPQSDPEEDFYINGSDNEEDSVDGGDAPPSLRPCNQACPLPPLPTDPKAIPVHPKKKKVLLPPNHPIAAGRPRSVSERETLPKAGQTPKIPMHGPDARSQSFSEELREKLQKWQTSSE